MKKHLAFFFLICISMTVRAQQPVNDTLLLDYYQNQRFADASDYLKKIYPEPIADLKALSSLAYTSQMSGKLADAENYYQRIYEKDSTNISLLFSLGNINVRRGNNKKALAYYDKILLRDSTNFNVYKQLATLNYNMGDFNSYLKYLQKANLLNHIDPDVATDLATIYINLKVFSRADTVISRALAADTTNLMLLHQKTVIDYRLEKFPQVISSCLLLIQGGGGADDVISMLGTSYFMLKQYNDCIITFQTLEKNNTGTETSYYYIAMSYKSLGEQKKTIHYLNKAIKKAISTNVGSYYSEMGDSYDKLRQLKNAATAYQKSLLYDSNPTITYYVMATLYDSELKNNAAAMKYYKKYLKADVPKNQKSYLEYAKKRIKELGR